MEVVLKATSHLENVVPPLGRVHLEDGSTVADLFAELGIDNDLVMLVVVNGELGDMDTPLSDGAAVLLIPPVSGG